MGNDVPLRSSSLLTKIMLREEEAVIQYLQDENIEINEPLNQVHLITRR